MLGSALSQAEEVVSRLLRVYLVNRLGRDPQLLELSGGVDTITDDLLAELRREEATPAISARPKGDDSFCFGHEFP